MAYLALVWVSEEVFLDMSLEASCHDKMPPNSCQGKPLQRPKLGQDKPHMGKSSPFFQAAQANLAIRQQPLSSRQVSGNPIVTPSNNLLPFKRIVVAKETLNPLPTQGHFGNLRVIT